MHFHFMRTEYGVVGWFAPDNPSTPSAVDIVTGDGTVTRMRTNHLRPDVRDAGFHHTGEVGFEINPDTFPGFNEVADHLEIRAPDSDLKLFRSFRPGEHLQARIFRFEMQAMPYAAVEAGWQSNFALYYNAIERHPFDTLRWILCSPDAPSVALSGRINLARYEHFLREHNFKFVTLLRDPYEELAERLLFVRYAKSANAKPEFRNHLSGIESLEHVSRRINLAVPNTTGEALAYLSEKQIFELSNPLVKALACAPEEPPRRLHVELALNRLATMDLVGARPSYDLFKYALEGMLSRDILPAELQTISSVAELAQVLREEKLVKSMLKYDEILFQFAKEAIDRALVAPVAPAGPATQLEDADTEMGAR